jgi:hypothetical protein
MARDEPIDEARCGEGALGMGNEHNHQLSWLSTSQNCPPHSALASSPFTLFFSASSFPSGPFRRSPGFSLYMQSARAFSSFLGTAVFASPLLYQRYAIRS